MIFGSNQFAGWEERLQLLVSELNASGNYKEFTLKRLQERVYPPSEQRLIKALVEHVGNGRLRVRYRVISPETKASIGSFDSPFLVPKTMIDESTGETISVDIGRNVEAVYTGETQLVR